jgi:hypothetical protein
MRIRARTSPGGAPQVRKSKPSCLNLCTQAVTLSTEPRHSTARPAAAAARDLGRRIWLVRRQRLSQPWATTRCEAWTGRRSSGARSTRGMACRRAAWVLRMGRALEGSAWQHAGCAWGCCVMCIYICFRRQRHGALLRSYTPGNQPCASPGDRPLPPTSRHPLRSPGLPQAAHCLHHTHSHAHTQTRRYMQGLGATNDAHLGCGSPTTTATAPLRPPVAHTRTHTHTRKWCINLVTRDVRHQM